MKEKKANTPKVSCRRLVEKLITEWQRGLLDKLLKFMELERCYQGIRTETIMCMYGNLKTIQ